MNPILERWARTILGPWVIFIFYTNLWGFGFDRGFLPPPVFGIAGSCLLIVSLCLGTARAATDWLGSPWFLWGFVYLVVSAIWMLPSPGMSADWAHLRDRVYHVGLLLVTALLWTHREARDAARKALVLAILGGVALNALDLLSLGSIGGNPGRGSGIYMNANVSGLTLLMGMLLAWDVLPERYRAGLYAAVAGGVLLTFSRSASLLVILSGAYLCHGGRLSWKSWGATCVLLTLMGFGAFAYLSTQGVEVLGKHVSADLAGRLQMAMDDFSSQERTYVLQLGLDFLQRSPWVGHGTGASLHWNYPVSTHNMYLNLMVDHGVFAVMLLPALVLAASPWRSRTSLLLGGLWLIMGFTSHNLLNNPAWLCLLGMVPYAEETSPGLDAS